VFTTERQVSRLVAFFHADERPIFSGFKSASIAHSQVCLGLPFGRFQSERGFWIADAAERWWPSFGELLMMWPKRRNLLSVMVWERGWQPEMYRTSILFINLLLLSPKAHITVQWRVEGWVRKKDKRQIVRLQKYFQSYTVTDGSKFNDTQKFVLSESLSPVKANIRVAASFGSVGTSYVKPRRTCLTLVALEQQMLTTVTVRQRQECLTNLQQRHTSNTTFATWYFGQMWM